VGGSPSYAQRIAPGEGRPTELPEHAGRKRC